MAFSSRVLLALLLSCSLLLPTSLADETFDVRCHLSTLTRYEVAREASDVGVSSSAIPDGCEPVHLNLVARHGTRAPTKKRIKELDRLAIRLEALVTDAKQILEEDALQKVPPWLLDGNLHGKVEEKVEN